MSSSVGYIAAASASEVFNVSTETIRRAIREGRLQAMSSGSGYLIPVEALLEYGEKRNYKFDRKLLMKNIQKEIILPSPLHSKIKKQFNLCRNSPHPINNIGLKLAEELISLLNDEKEVFYDPRKIGIYFSKNLSFMSNLLTEIGVEGDIDNCIYTSFAISNSINHFYKNYDGLKNKFSVEDLKLKRIVSISVALTEYHSSIED
jgi:excisionase family DNA binding protein